MRALARLRPYLTCLTVSATLIFGCSATARSETEPEPTAPSEAPVVQRPVSKKHLARGAATADLSAHLHAMEQPVGGLSQRHALLEQRKLLHDRGDAAALAHLNSVLASEAFSRAARVTERWLDRRDAETGLFPHTLQPDGRVWTYGDAGADLFPFLAVGTRYLLSERYPEILRTLAAERGISPSFPRDLSLEDGKVVKRESEKRMLGAVEYAKDGLLPLVEALGPDPWLPRMQEVADQVLAASDVPTTAGPIPSQLAETNGSALQALARLYWLTRDQRYLEMGRRIAGAYLDRAHPITAHIPPHRWDFMKNEPIGPQRFYLGDHGNEIVSGLIEWHRVEIMTDAPERLRHREGIRKMLDRLLTKGRTPDGLWYEVLEVPSGKVREKGLTDNWGYLGQAYLNQAEIERDAPDGDLDRAARYERAAATMLRAVATVDFYSWEEGTMDGYADTLEGAISLLRYVDVPEAAEWVDEQMGVLYGFQHPDGHVTDENIDGNFIRTVMLYGLRMTKGVRVEPWSDAVSVGATSEGDCLHMNLHTEEAWSGRVVFDTLRHGQHLKLTEDYPRINQWPEHFAIDPGLTYTVVDGQQRSSALAGGDLIRGYPVSLTPGQAHTIRACRPSSP